jgi:alpha-galactosidase
VVRTHLNVQGLTAEAALTGRHEPVCHAAMLEPHAAAERPVDEIRALVDALLEAHGD